MPLIIPLASALVLRATVSGISFLGLLSWVLRTVLANVLKREHGGLLTVVSGSSEELAVATIIVTMPSPEDLETSACLLSTKAPQHDSSSSVMRFSLQARPDAAATPTHSHVLDVLEDVTIASTAPQDELPEPRSSATSEDLPPNYSLLWVADAPTTLSSQPHLETLVPTPEPPSSTPTPSTPTAQSNAIEKTSPRKLPSPPAWLRWHKRSKATPTILPRQQGPPRKTLVLDLDQTLVECLHLTHTAMSPPNFMYTDCEGLRANVWLRPHLITFLEAVSQDFEVVLFTAAAQRHADAVLKHVDPDRTLVHHRLYGHHTVAAPQWAWVKDLSRLGRDLSQTLIIDDCSTAALFQLDSWVSIAPFTHLSQGWREDTALLDILRFLKDHVLPAPDTREAIRQHYSQVACRPFVVGAPGTSEEEGQGGSNQMQQLGQRPVLEQCQSNPAAQCSASLPAAGAGCMSAADSMHRVRTVRHCLSVASSHG